MAENSKIEWTDHTFNPWIGCMKVSHGCTNCYAETLMDKRFGKVEWGPTGTRKRTSESYWKKPLAWNNTHWRECQNCGWRGPDKDAPFAAGAIRCPACTFRNPEPTRQRVFCASLADVFEDRPELHQWRSDLLGLIGATPNLDWLLLTKRPGKVNRLINIATGRFADRWFADNPHVWIGTSVEDQRTADERISQLLDVPASVRFLSMEPLLGPVTLTGFNGPFWGKLPPSHFLHWAIVGGESGPNARPFDIGWAMDLRDECEAAQIPFFMKQLGSCPIDGPAGYKTGYPITDRKGEQMWEWPEELRVRQFPEGCR